MPVYVFRCGKDTGGCDWLFEVKAPMSEATNLSPKCPSCKKSKHIHRDWSEENVSVCDGPKTVGSLADKNTSKMSNDQQYAINQKNTEYLRKEYDGPLPDGARLFERDSEGNVKPGASYEKERPKKVKPKGLKKYEPKKRGRKNVKNK